MDGLEQAVLHMGPPPVGDLPEERAARLRHLGAARLLTPGRSLTDQQVGPLTMFAAPGHVQGDNCLDALSRALVTPQLGEKRLLVHLQGLRVENAEDVFLAGEVMVETADADAALRTKAGQRGGRDTVLTESTQGTLDDPGAAVASVLG